MASSNTVRIELLNKENYDTWKIQMQALLTKNEAWAYGSGQKQKPEVTQQNEEAVNRWILEDEKAKADIILSIKPSQLKQIKECRTSRELWLKLQSIYQSSGPARKAALIKQLTYHHMQEDEDMREHIQKFFDTVDRLNEMDVEINHDLIGNVITQSPILLWKFPLRDTLPSLEALRIKIIAESDARKHENREVTTSTTYGKRQFNKKQNAKNMTKDQDWKKNKKTQNTTKSETFKFKCHQCRKIGHKAS